MYGVKEELIMRMDTHDSFLSESWSPFMIVETYNVIATLTTMERETTTSGLINRYIKNRNPSYKQFKHKKISRFERGKWNQIRNKSKWRNKPLKKKIFCKFWTGVLHERNITFNELIQKVGKEILKGGLKYFSLLKHFKNSIFEGSVEMFQRINPSNTEKIEAEMLISWISQMQICFQPKFSEFSNGEIANTIEEQVWKNKTVENY